MSLKRSDGLSLGAVGLVATVTALVYERLPLRVATHFDAHGTPNGFMPRALGAWFLPVFALGLWAIVRWSRLVLPRRERERLDERTLALVASLTTVFLAALHVLVLWFALSPGAPIMRPLWLFAGVVFVALGLVLPRVKRNAIVGVRTPWTLASDENWARTQRVGGYAMVASGVLAAIAGMSGGAVGTVIATLLLVVSGIVPAVYSLVLARRLDRDA